MKGWKRHSREEDQGANVEGMLAQTNDGCPDEKPRAGVEVLHYARSSSVHLRLSLPKDSVGTRWHRVRLGLLTTAPLLAVGLLAHDG